MALDGPNCRPGCEHGPLHVVVTNQGSAEVVAPRAVAGAALAQRTWAACGFHGWNDCWSQRRGIAWGLGKYAGYLHTWALLLRGCCWGPVGRLVCPCPWLAPGFSVGLLFLLHVACLSSLIPAGFPLHFLSSMAMAQQAPAAGAQNPSLSHAWGDNPPLPMHWRVHARAYYTIWNSLSRVGNLITRGTIEHEAWRCCCSLHPRQSGSPPPILAV